MWLNPLRFPRYRGTETPQRAKKAFRGKTKCLSVPDEGSHIFYGDGGQGESPLATVGKALCKWITPIPLRPCKGLIIVGGMGIIDRGKPLSCVIGPFQGHRAMCIL